MSNGPGDRGRPGGPVPGKPARRSSSRPYGLPPWVVVVVLVLAGIGALSIVRTVLSLAVTAVELVVLTALVVGVVYVLSLIHI